jgi:serine/threonine protein kinase
MQGGHRTLTLQKGNPVREIETHYRIKKFAAVNRMSSHLVSLSAFKKLKGLKSSPHGKSYLTQDKTTQECFIVKTLADITTDNGDLVPGLEFLANVEHPVLLSLHGYSVPNPAKKAPLAICTRFFPEGSLASLFESKKPITNGFRLKVLFAIAEGLRHLHAIGIAHRFLTPSNVLIDERFEPRICDFGLGLYRAVDMPDFAQPFNGTETETSLDVFCFGAIAYFVLTGLPFPDSGLPALPDELPTTFKDLIISCWIQPPADRPKLGIVVLGFLRDDYTLPMEPNEKCDFVEYRSRIVSPSFTNRSLIGAFSTLHSVSMRTKELAEIVQRLEKTVASLAGGGEEAT